MAQYTKYWYVILVLGCDTVSCHGSILQQHYTVSQSSRSGVFTAVETSYLTLVHQTQTSLRCTTFIWFHELAMVLFCIIQEIHHKEDCIFCEDFSQHSISRFWIKWLHFCCLFRSSHCWRGLPSWKGIKIHECGVTPILNFVKILPLV